MTRPRKKSRRKRDSNPGPSALEADALTTRPTRRWSPGGASGSNQSGNTSRTALLIKFRKSLSLGVERAYTTTPMSSFADDLLAKKAVLRDPHCGVKPGRLQPEAVTCWKSVCLEIGWLVACLTSQQHASVSQGRICSDNCTCCHTEIGAADQTFYLTQSTVY